MLYTFLLVLLDHRQHRARRRRPAPERERAAVSPRASAASSSSAELAHRHAPGRQPADEGELVVRRDLPRSSRSCSRSRRRAAALRRRCSIRPFTHAGSAPRRLRRRRRRTGGSARRRAHDARRRPRTDAGADDAGSEGAASQEAVTATVTDQRRVPRVPPPRGRNPFSRPARRRRRHRPSPRSCSRRT